MIEKPLLLLSAASVLLLANAAPRPAPAHAYVLDEMAGQIAPQAQVIWDITNGAQDDDGNPVAAKVKPQDWIRMQQAGEAMTAALIRIKRADAIHVRRPDQKVLDEKTSSSGLSAAKIQTYIDANPQGLRAMAVNFTEVSRSITRAAAARDIQKINAIANDLDQACEACHKAFWYPEAQKQAPQ
jgi:hypothetical protein